VPDADEPGSTTYNQQAWKHVRNEQLVEISRQNEEHAGELEFCRGRSKLMIQLKVAGSTTLEHCITMRGHCSLPSIRLILSWRSPTTRIMSGELKRSGRRMKLMEQYLGLEVPEKAQQVFEPEHLGKQYFWIALYQRGC
jgi:hypothetical protein